MIVAIEGLDGVGKTTVAGLITSVLDSCEVLHTPPRPYYDGNIEVLRDLTSQTRAVLFAAGILAVNYRLQQPQTMRTQVIDRFVGSITGMNRALYPDLGNVCRELALVCPDITIELTCEESVRVDRLRKRGKPLDPFEMALAKDAALRNHMRESIRETAINYVEIDTTRLSPTQAAQLCLIRIEECLPVPRQKHVMDGAAIAALVDQLADSGLREDEIIAQIGIRSFFTASLHSGALAESTFAGRMTGVELVRQAREVIAHLGETELTSERALLVGALDDIELGVRSSGVESSRLNEALAKLQPAFTQARRTGIYIGLTQLVARAV